jgi:hypothetical protein
MADSEICDEDLRYLPQNSGKILYHMVVTREGGGQDSVRSNLRTTEKVHQISESWGGLGGLFDNGIR